MRTICLGVTIALMFGAVGFLFGLRHNKLEAALPFCNARPAGCVLVSWPARQSPAGN
jgi:hypothetical protein